MAFSRRSADCAVYTFEHVDGTFVCCDCIIRAPSGRPPWTRAFSNRTELVEHLRQHQALGHQVPERVIDCILED